MEFHSKSPGMYKREYWESVSDLSNIEECLITPPNQQVFLTASMAFLQKRLEDKLDEKQNISNNNKFIGTANNRNYSSLLVFELDNGISSDRYFVRVQNNEQYQEVLKRECTVSSREKLSLDQILPKPKKPKSKNKGFLKRLKSSSLKLNIMRETAAPKSSMSFLTIFKRSTPNPSQCDLSCVSTTSVTLKLPSTPSQNSMLSGFIKPQRTESCCSNGSVKINELPRSCSRMESIALMPMILGPEEVEILQSIPNSPSQCYRKDSPRRRKSKNFQQEYSVPFDRGVPFTRTYSSNCNSSVRVCSSKLSVCLEDEEEEEEEEEYATDRESVAEGSTYGSCNLTDEVKSNFSTEGLDIIMRRLMQYFEYNTPGEVV